MARPLSSVHVDIARLTLEVFKASTGENPDKNLADWTRKFCECLATRNPALHDYGAHLLSEASGYMEEQSDKKRAAANAKWAKRAENAGAESAMHSDAPAQIILDIVQNDATEQSRAEQSIREEIFVKNCFDQARKAYPGTRRGLDVEWANFEKKYDKEKARIVPLLLPSIEAEKAHKARLVAEKKFCPEWANFSTWINQSRWTQELPPGVAPAPMRYTNGG